ncbi:MAG: c-type cytochrome [Pirellulales bacterium]
MNQSVLTTCERRRWALGALLMALAAGCTPPGKPNPADRPVLPDEVMSFDQLFSTNCAGCHGANGELGPAPPLNDPLFLAIIPDEDLLGVIRNGRPGTPMPPFLIDKGGSLTEKQISALIQEMKSQWLSEAVVPESTPAYLLSKAGGVQTSPGSRQRGEQVFARACAGCHGANGLGVDHEHSTGGPINVPAFLALISDQAIRRIIITGRPDLKMPNYAETKGRPDGFQPLTSAEIDDLVALIADWRGAGAVARSGDQQD